MPPSDDDADSEDVSDSEDDPLPSVLQELLCGISFTESTFCISFWTSEMGK